MIFNVSFQLVLKKEEYIENNSVLRMYDSLVVTEPYLKVGDAIVITKKENNLYKSNWCINLCSGENKYVYTFSVNTDNDIIFKNKGVSQCELEIVNKDGVLCQDIDFMGKNNLNVFFEINSLSTNIYVNINNENDIKQECEGHIKENNFNELNEEKEDKEKKYLDIKGDDRLDIKTETNNESEKEIKGNINDKFDLTILEERILYDIMKRIEELNV
jgi:hypothetical protein